MKPTIIDAIQNVCRKNHDGGFSIVGDEDSITDLSTTKLSSGDALKFTFEDAKTELSTLIAEYDSQEYARNRQSEYPTIEDLTIALYDTDDKAALETKRAAVKTKWPKDNSGPIE